ncbi:hypothetical protein RSAG8_09407, partial [Rhizoctonia solani AG-8 WAC10335]
MSPKEESPPPTAPVWCTGPEQIEVKLVVTGETYNVDVDIAKRMGIIQEGSKPESPFGLKGCSRRDFESALTFCAQDRTCAKSPSEELTHIIQETAPPAVVPPSASPEPEPKPAPEASTSPIQTSLANMTLANDEDEDDDEDESYAPTESDSSDSEDISDTDPTDIGTANIQAEHDEYNAREKQKQKQNLPGL